jgi:alkanesulfonate monooxygenase SsuD/methylene tetrahydromethanopterin reductase-like flavin-dependent oxidoreductase (luciferase family)
LRRLGWTDDDLAGDGSDRLVDALVGWGTPDEVAARVRAHRERGADHVAVRVLGEDRTRLPLRELADLSEALGLRDSG